MEPIKNTTPGMRKMLLIASILVFSIGVSLFLLTENTDLYFAWTIKSPVTAAFLGACYWASGVLELAASREKAWINARSSVPAVWVFTSITLIVTFLHWDRFHFSAPRFITVLGTWVWVGVYLFVPVILGFLWLRQVLKKGAHPNPAAPLPSWMRGSLGLMSLLMLPLGISFLLFPNTASSFWAWDLTPLTARATGAWLVGWAVLFGCCAWENNLRSARATFLTLIALSLFVGVAIFRFPQSVDWQGPSGWTMLLLLAAFALIGTWGLALQARIRTDALP